MSPIKRFHCISSHIKQPALRHDLQEKSGNYTHTPAEAHFMEGGSSSWPDAGAGAGGACGEGGGVSAC